ncbi:sarcoplasmic calcium-binding protein 1 isoform X2 [Penaeus japonicus]|uniref:sarcoplasmic calcium-binding protein 1 isoform X2 n=1 Tax=Penaeus japonicus TaxID=27405 RepID=UPI001C70F479|nr:sarcoplasmic calcium-binding protein 1 isoform X2 [Penaeus japonicus]
MAYTWDNRVKYVVRYMYDIDNNGFLDKNDFECLAVRNTLIEGRGEFSADAYANNQKIMRNLWNEIAELADFNKNGEVTVDEFRKAVQNVCVGKSFNDFPTCFKVVISNFFKTVDVNGDGMVGLDEYRLDCITRSAFADVKEIDEAYNKLTTEDDRKAGGLTLARYQDLYAQFISNPDESCSACYLFGPLKVVQ